MFVFSSLATWQMFQSEEWFFAEGFKETQILKVVSDFSFFFEREEILIWIKATNPNFNWIMLAVSNLP